MASGYGKLYFCRLSYRPVLGDRKSGIPLLTLIPAPTWKSTSSACMNALHINIECYDEIWPGSENSIAAFTTNDENVRQLRVCLQSGLKRICLYKQSGAGLRPSSPSAQLLRRVRCRTARIAYSILYREQEHPCCLQITSMEEGIRNHKKSSGIQRQNQTYHSNDSTGFAFEDTLCDTFQVKGVKHCSSSARLRC